MPPAGSTGQRTTPPHSSLPPGFRIDTKATTIHPSLMENHPIPAPESKPPDAQSSWAIALHLSGFAIFILPTIGQILAPLILWLIKRPESPYLDRVGKEVLNFQISYTIYAVIAGALVFVVVGCVLLPAIFICWVVFIIIAAVKTSNGEDYQYPFTIRLLQ